MIQRNTNVRRMLLSIFLTVVLRVCSMMASALFVLFMALSVYCITFTNGTNPVPSWHVLRAMDAIPDNVKSSPTLASIAPNASLFRPLPCIRSVLSLAVLVSCKSFACTFHSL